MRWLRLGQVLASGLLAVAVASAQSDPSRRGLVLVPGANAPLTGQTYALLIGVSDYQKDPPVASLKYAHKDAEALAELLKSPLGGGLKDPDQIRLLTNRQATRAAIDDAILNFVAPHAAPENTLILFVAAHGVYLKSEEDPITHRIIERDPYILTHESNYQDPKTTGYPMDEFRRMIFGQALSFGRVFVFVDVCHAGNVAGIAGGAELEPAVQKVFQGQAGDLGILLATQAKKFAYESENFGGGHGAFSYFLIAGMNGLAANEDSSIITFADLQGYVTRNVSDYTRRAQQPEGNSTNPDVVLVRDTKQAGVKIEPAEKISASAVRDAKNQRPFSTTRPTLQQARAAATGEAFDLAIASGRLLPEEPNNAGALLAQMRQDPNQLPEDVRAREQRFYVALADRGQQIMSRYLDGDQVPQTKADFERCARYFQEARRIMPTSSSFDDSRELFCRGRALIFDRQYDQAETLLNSSIQMDPRRAYAYNALGIAELERSARTGQGLEAAVDAFQMAMRFAPYWAYPLHNLALLESERGNYDVAIDLYQRAMRVAPLYSYLPYNLGLLYLRLGDSNNAAQWLEKARQLAENMRIDQPGPWVERSEIWNAMGTIARSKRQQNRALEYFQKALADNPGNANARQNAALILARRNDFVKADALWLENLALTPKFLPSWIAYAESLATRGETSAAAGLYEQIVVDEAEYVGAREALARLYLKQQQPARAQVHLEAALRITPMSAGILELRGDVGFALGQRDSARTDWSQALEQSDDRAAKTRIKRKLRTLQ